MNLVPPGDLLDRPRRRLSGRGGVLLREILLPFVAGLVLAYLLNPLANRLERLGLNRLVAALVIIGGFAVVFVGLLLLTAPLIARELAYFLDNLPVYFRQLEMLTNDESRPWLKKLVGEGLGSAEQSIGELASLAVDWFGRMMRSVWSGGEALISVFSLAIVTPVVAGYLIYDWNDMLAAVDNWTPPAHRATVQGARPRDRRHHRRVRARPGHALPDPERILRRWR